jgi:3-oxoacyl-[acyl-carrier protein] reductase
MRLKDKVCVITGSAKGIGKVTALSFAKEGAKLVLSDFDVEAGAETLAEVKAAGAEAIFAEVDVTKREQVENMFSKAMETFGRVDVLINNAGITMDGFLVKIADAQWDKVISVNLTGVFYCTQTAAKIMIEQGSGCILNVSSVVGVYGNIGQTNYAATKSGVIGMTKSWAKELGPKGIRVNALAPGFIVSDMTAKVPQKVLDLMEEKTPLKRLGQPIDIANAYVFLASDEANFINGAVLGVDGGLQT